VVEQVLRENESRWESLSEADRARVELLARTVVNRLLHEPTVRLKGGENGGGSYVYLQAVRELFGLEPEAPDYELGNQKADVASLEERRRRGA
jgi:glutamyl-tRNA reductase